MYHLVLTTRGTIVIPVLYPCVQRRILSSPCPATRNFRFLRCSPAPSHCCFNSLFTGLVRVSVKIPQDGNRTRVRGSGATVPTRIQSRGFCILIKDKSYYHGSKQKNYLKLLIYVYDYEYPFFHLLNIQKQSHARNNPIV